MKKIYLLLAFTFFVFSLFSQTISGIAVNVNQISLDGCTVGLLNSKDSSIYKWAVTGTDGKFIFTNAKKGSYIIAVTRINYEKAYSSEFNFSGAENYSVPTIQLIEMPKQLSNITVRSEKPIVEVRADKTILNVEGTINAIGNDALELLRKSPGVMIDKDDNVSLAGKNGVQIYIDGKPSPLSGTDLSYFLKSLQSAQIESIEIITNPSAKYEAAGNAGIINIRLKKNRSLGANAALNLGYVQSVYPKYNGGLNFNYRNKRLNVFGNYNYNYGKYQRFFLNSKEIFDTLFDQTNRSIFYNNTHGFKTGMDYFVNNKSTIGISVNGTIANNVFNSAGPMYFVYIPTGTVSRILKATSDNTMKRNNINTNLNYRFSDTKGKELNIDLDYGYFRLGSNQYQPNYYYKEDGVTETSQFIYKMIAPTDINLYSFKVDYEQNLKKGRLGIGGKLGIVNTDNDFRRYNIYTVAEILDTTKSNRFTYEENISALYLNYNHEYKKGLVFQFGLRMEKTHSKGTSTGFQKEANYWINYDSLFKRNYIDLFPSASVTLNKNPKNQWTISYSRRIDRPAYQDLNPFEFKLNEYTYLKGNTMLRPQYTNSFGLVNVLNFKLTTTLNYSHVTDIFAQLPDTVEKTKSFLTKKNLATQDVVAINISYPFQYKWYSFFTTINANYSHYLADFGGGDRKVNQTVFALTYFMQNTFKLGKGWTGELSGLYLSPSVWQGVIRTGAMGAINTGLQKIVFKEKGTVKFGVDDIFKTMRWSGKSNFAGVNGTFSGHGEQPQIKVNLIYRFGNNQVKAARQRKSSIDEERKRAESSDQN